MDRDKLQSIYIPLTAMIKEAVKQLNDTARKTLLVTDSHERLIGTITDGDIRRGILTGCGFNEPVEKIMCRDYIALDYTDPDIKLRARDIMIQHNIPAVPLLDHQDRVKGVVFLADVIGGQEIKKARRVYDHRVVVMAGGKGTRLDVFTKVFPKSLIPIGDKPAIEFIMERFYACGFHKFTYTLNYKKEYVKLFLKEKQFPSDYEIDWVEEDKFLGTAGSLSLLQQSMTDTFFVVNCDTVLNIDFSEVLAWHKERSAALTVIGCHNEVDIPFGVLAHTNGTLEKIHEKPSHDVIVNTGVYIMEPRVLTYLQPGQPIDMNELINKIATKETVSIYPVYSRDWFDIGQWDTYKRSTKFLEEQGNV